MGAYYNGYSWKQREGILEEYKRLIRADTTQALGYLLKKSSCEICADSDSSIAWHSEDYSRPYLFSPPATFNICAVCHLRLHKRFNQPREWLLYLEHLKSGGFGWEFVKLYSVHQRNAWIDSSSNGSHIDLPHIRRRHLTSFEWWLSLSLDPESLVAPWARPRPWRPRPSTDVFKAALATVKTSASELALLTAHARSPRRTATMRQLALEALGSDNPQIANLLYGRLCRRLSELLPWTPDRRSDGSPIWLSIVAEGWQPPKREFEWILVPSLQVLFTEMKSLPLIPAKEWTKSDKSEIGKYGIRPSPE